MKNVLSPLAPCTLCVTHIKQSKGTTALAYVLTVCTHIICHTALSVIIAWWGHQHPHWEQPSCLMCGMHHSSATAPHTTRTLPQSLSVNKWSVLLARWHAVSLQHGAWVPALCNVCDTSLIFCFEYIHHACAQISLCCFKIKSYLRIVSDTNMRLHVWHDELWKGFMSQMGHTCFSYNSNIMWIAGHILSFHTVTLCVMLPEYTD